MTRVVLLGVAWAASVASAQPAALKAHLEAAESRNLDRRLSQEQRARAEAEYRQAWTALLPSLTASGAWTHNEYEASANFPNPSTGEITKLVIVPGDQFDAVLRFELPLIDTGRWYRALAASSASNGAEHRETATLDHVRRAVVTGFYQYASGLAVHEAAKKSALVALAQLKLTEVRFQVGAVTELETLRAAAEVARTKQVVADTETLVVTSRRNLASLSGLTPPDALEMPEDDLRPEPPYETLVQGLDALPAVRAADQDAEAASRVALASKLALVPMVSAQFTERFTNATGFQNASNLYNAGVTFAWRLDVPTFQAMDAQSRNRASAQLLAQKARMQARDLLLFDWQRFSAALVKVEAAKAQVDAAGKAAQVARDRFAAGAATQIDLIQAERDLFGAEVNQIQARSELAQARASVHLSAGMPLGEEMQASR